MCLTIDFVLQLDMIAQDQPDDFKKQSMAEFNGDQGIYQLEKFRIIYAQEFYVYFLENLSGYPPKKAVLVSNFYTSKASLRTPLKRLSTISCILLLSYGFAWVFCYWTGASQVL